MNTTTHGTNTDSLRDALYAYALELTHNNSCLAQELLQETLSQIVHEAISYSTISSFMTHTCKVMKHTYNTTIHEADMRELHRLCYYANGTAYTPEEIIYAMSRLTPQQATVVTLCLKGYSADEIARTTGHTTQWVNSNILKSRQRLRNLRDN